MSTFSLSTSIIGLSYHEDARNGGRGTFDLYCVGRGLRQALREHIETEDWDA
jgi:hypothetical protein